jgi:hypothetical protein
MVNQVGIGHGDGSIFPAGQINGGLERFFWLTETRGAKLTSFSKCIAAWMTFQPICRSMVSNGSMLAYRPAFMASGVHMVAFL